MRRLAADKTKMSDQVHLSERENVVVCSSRRFSSQQKITRLFRKSTTERRRLKGFARCPNSPIKNAAKNCKNLACLID